MLLAGNFRWFYRKRLRITLKGDAVNINQTPVELNDQQLQVDLLISIPVLNICLAVSGV